MFHEHHSRSILKSITWFVTAFTMTFIMLTILSQNWRTGLFQSITLQIIKACVYYIYERVWNKSDFGQKIREANIVPSFSKD